MQFTIIILRHFTWVDPCAQVPKVLLHRPVVANRAACRILLAATSPPPPRPSLVCGPRRHKKGGAAVEGPSLTCCQVSGVKGRGSQVMDLSVEIVRRAFFSLGSGCSCLNTVDVGGGRRVGVVLSILCLFVSLCPSIH